MKVKCDFCKQEFCSTPYLFNHDLKKKLLPISQSYCCEAKVDARFLCVYCGEIFVKNFSKEITPRDVERIVFGERSKENAE